MKKNESRLPLLVAVLTYGLWGLLPVYWKLLAPVPAVEVLAHRIFWSFLFLCILIATVGRWKNLTAEARALLANRKRTLCLLAGAIFLSLNWLIFIWAVNHDRVVESGLGYYIHPLLNVLVGVAFFGERLSMRQLLAVLLAAAGVFYLTVNYGSVPFVALSLAASITLYGVFKKITGLSALGGLTLETALLFPPAVLYFLVIYANGSAYPIAPTPTFFFLAGAGVVTAVPLLCFAYSLKHLPLSLIGLISYISPSVTLILGVFVYREPFTSVHLISFILIWVGLGLFSAAKRLPS